jgi:hypothetical protein
MNPFFDYNAVADAVAQVRGEGGTTSLQSYKPEESADFNELLVFLKPELTTKYPDDPRTFLLCAEKFEDFACECVAAAVLSPAYLSQGHLIEAHYGLINAYSIGGLDALPAAGQQQAQALLKEEGLADTPILGAHQVLERYPEVTSQDLLSWHDSAAETYRLASGAYSFLHEIDGKTVMIIDGFHPAQLAHFYGTRDPLVVFAVRSTTPWATLRTQMCGATNPAKAEEGSIRRILLERRSELALDQFDAMRNGIHVSAGPIEASVEIARYLAIDGPLKFTDTSFGAVLAEELGHREAEALAANGAVVREDGSQALAFDATEHVDARDALELLRHARV